MKRLLPIIFSLFAMFTATSAYAVSIPAPLVSDIIVDNGDAGYSETPGWTYNGGATTAYGGDVSYMSSGSGSEIATWTPTIPSAGTYHVYVSWTTFPNRATDAPYTVNYNGGSQTFDVNQELLADQVTTGGNKEWSGWYLLGTFEFAPGTGGNVQLSNDADQYVMADAVKFVSTTQYVDDDMVECPYASFSSIQSAVDSALPGDSVEVCAGTYAEQVVINKDLQLTGTGNPVIVSVNLPEGFSIPENSRVWEPVVFAFGGEESEGGVSGAGRVDVDISGFIIDGNDRAPANGIRSAGILYRNANGTIEENTVRNMHIGDAETFGVIVYGDSDVIIRENMISGYSRGGIGANGDIGSLPDPNARILDNTVIGPGLGIPVTWAPNGIQFGWGATGDARRNVVKDNGWPGSAWSGSGIIIAASENILIRNNTIRNNETGVAVTGDNWYGSGGTADNVKIIKNRIRNNEYGISIQDRSDNVIVDGNKIFLSVYNGIGITNFYGLHPTGTQIVNNDIYDNNTSNDPTSGGLWVDSSIGTAVNARNNWWGDCTGPYNDPGNLGGLGNAVIGNADFSPWSGACNASLGGKKFHDINGNGTREIDEPALSGWEIVATNTDSLTSTTTVTDINGEYVFTGLEIGNYQVSEVIPSGWVQSYPESPDYHEVSLGFGDSVDNLDFGNYQYGEIRGIKYEDVNGNGIQDGESGLAGWEINLMQGVNLISATTTDINGEYRFTNITPGVYEIHEVQKPGWIQTYPVSPNYHTVTTTSGSLISGIDFGNQLETGDGTISGMKFNDINGNGERDIDTENPENSEPGIADWKIKLKNLDTGIVVSTLTDPDGNYSFTDLVPGRYRVVEKQKSGWIQTYPTNPSSYTVVLEPEGFIDGLDFGNFELAQISGVKYEDINGNGQLDVGEPLLPNWRIILEGPYGTREMLTGPDGEFSFTDIGPGSYTLKEETKPDWGQSQPGPGNNYEYTITPESGNVFVDVNFGNYRYATIKGRKYRDKNLNGSRDFGEPWLRNWTIKLINLQTGEIMEDTTNRRGRYKFTQLSPGNYIVQEILQNGWIPVNPASSIYKVSISSNQVLGGLNFGNATLQDKISNTLSGRFGGYTFRSGRTIIEDEDTASPLTSQEEQTDSDLVQPGDTNAYDTNNETSANYSPLPTPENDPNNQTKNTVVPEILNINKMVNEVRDRIQRQIGLRFNR